MFDFDIGKLFIIGVVALVVIGPKDLPRVLRQVGQAVGKLRRMSSEFQRQFMDAMHEADLDDLKAEAKKLAEEARVEVHYDPVLDAKRHLTQAVQGVTAPIAEVHAQAVQVAEGLPELRAEIPGEGPVGGPAIEARVMPPLEPMEEVHGEAGGPVKNTAVLP